MGAQTPALGSLVVHEGRAFTVRGYSRMSLGRQHIDLEDAATRDRITVPVDDVVVLRGRPSGEPGATVVPLRPDA